MKLKSFRVTEYRSVWDSNEVKVGDVTCLVGKNEAGKTTLLRALYGLNPVVDGDGKFDVTDDYPRREVGDYRHDVDEGEREPAEVVKATYELEASDVSVVEKVFGPKALTAQTLSLQTTYENARAYSLSVDEAAALKHVISTAQVPEPAKQLLSASNSWQALLAALQATEASAEITRLTTLVTSVSKHSASYYIYNTLLNKRVPKFLYFDEYYQMAGHENVQALISRKAANTLQPSDRPLLGLVNLARLSLEDLLNSQRTVELVNSLEAAGNHLTRQILKYWSQNKHLQMKFDVREARPSDPPHMRSGQNIWGRVYDSVHWATTELSSRSKGFVWFFSFLAWYEDVKRGGQSFILLLDEPGLSLHGRAQGDLLRYIEDELRPHHQVIYTTHSPFMVDPRHFDRVRIVQDAGIDANDQLPKELDGTKVLADVFDASDDSLFPLQGALGYDIHQTLFIGPNTLVVEGPADLIYLKEMSAILDREGRTGLDKKWIVTPVGGSGKIPTFVSLLAPQKGMKVAVLMDFQASDKQLIEGIYKKKLLQKKNVVTYADVIGLAEADVEDMFDREFYLKLVNDEYSTQLAAKIAPSHLNPRITRVLVAIEEWLESKPLKSGTFGHFRPARKFSEGIGQYAAKIDEATKARFEKLFQTLNALL